MHTFRTTQSSCSPPPGFRPDFFRVPAALSSAQDDGRQHVADGAGKIHYCADTYPTHAGFCASADFPRYQYQVRQALDVLVGFCASQAVPDTADIAARFDMFYSHRFYEQYFDKHVPALDCQGKQSLDNICGMVGDTRFSVEKKKTAIRNLSEGVVACASGVTANMTAIERDLAVSAEGIRAILWKAKEEIVRADVQRLVSLPFSKNPGYAGNEIHYVTAVWNYIADAAGLLAIPDGRARTLGPEFLRGCERTVLDALTPDRLARFIAEQFQGVFNSRFAARGRASSGLSDHRINEAFLDILESIYFEYKLESSALGLEAFVRLDCGNRYEVRSDPTLIARNILTLMHQEGLLNVAPVNRGEWVDGDGSPRALYTYGSALAWQAVPAAGPSHDPVWDGGQDAELLTKDDLYAWCRAWRPEGGAPPHAALLQVIVNTDIEALDDIPDAWLRDPHLFEAMLAKSNGEQVERLLQGNYAYVLAGLPAADRARLIDERLGSGPAILSLARQWYYNAWFLLGSAGEGQVLPKLHQWMASNNWQAIDALMHETDGVRYLHTGTKVIDATILRALTGYSKKPALHDAMARGHTKAIRAWHRLLSDPLVTGRIAAGLPALLEARSAEGMPALAQALANGRAGAIDAFHELLADPSINFHVQQDVGRLLLATSNMGPPGLMFAMEQGHAEAVKAYHKTLVDPAVLRHILRGLPTLVTAGSARGSTALLQAMLFGRAEAIGAFHAILADPRILPHICKALPRLFTARRQDGRTALAAALGNGHADAIDAFHKLLADPSITPHIERFLPKLLAARTTTPTGDTGLGLALQYGRADAIKAYHRLLTDPAILPLVKRHVPKLLAAQRRDRASGLSLALRHNHARAIAAFADILVDPRIFPLIGYALPKVLTAADAAGRPGLLMAVRANQSAAVAAFYELLDRPEFAHRAGSDLVRTLRALPAREAAAMAEAGGATIRRDAVDTVSAGASLRMFLQRAIRRAASRWT